MQGASKRDAAWLTGRTDTMKRVVFENVPLPAAYAPIAGLPAAAVGAARMRARPGDYVAVEVTAASAGTLKARALAVTTLRNFVAVHGSCNPVELRAPPSSYIPASLHTPQGERARVAAR